LVRAVAEAKITSTSVILGTAAYLSPEQVSTGDAGPRSDVYSVGILTYELLTGVTPFTGDSALAVAYQRMDSDVPPPGRMIAGVPAQFDELVAQSTAREPADRYADAQDMGADLAAIVAELGLPPFRVPAPRNSAQHLSAALHHNQIHAQQQTTETTARPPVAAVLAPRQHTRELTRDDWVPQEPEYEPVSGQFAGIDLENFYWARQRAKRVLLFWLLSVLTLTALIAAAAWTLGSNIGNLV
jgi:serine/threonine protein kinase, bacterial